LPCAAGGATRNCDPAHTDKAHTAANRITCPNLVIMLSCG
jgi:hypothetical protein